MPAVSVIVPVYNAGWHLPRCVQSIQSQTMRDLEIVLVDDGSVDGSAQLCEELALADDRIRVFHKKTAGLPPRAITVLIKPRENTSRSLTLMTLSIPRCFRFSSMARNRLGPVLRHARTCVCVKKRASMLPRKMQKAPLRRSHARARGPWLCAFRN